jgi:hypothetical protein
MNIKHDLEDCHKIYSNSQTKSPKLGKGRKNSLGMLLK